MQQVKVIDCQSDDRIRYVWALRLVAGDIAKLDQLDRENGRLPLPIRPSFLLLSNEAMQIRQILLKPTLEAFLAKLLERLTYYFEGPC